MNLKIIIFEDTPQYALELPRQIEKQLASKGKVKLFKPSGSRTHGIYEEEIAKELRRPEYNNPTLVVADRDLSQTENYRGMSESIVRRVADKLGIPECAYARGAPADGFVRDAEQRESRIALALTGKPEIFARKVVSIAEGFDTISKSLPAALRTPDKISHGKVLASILGKPEYADKITLYASGAPASLGSVLQVCGSKKEANRRLTCLLGYWLWDSILRFPGVVVNEIAASSYLNIREDIFHRPIAQALFKKARYVGPFADAKDPMWWRGMLDDIVAKSGCDDGRTFVAKELGQTISRSKCCEDPSKPAGYYCMFSQRPVSLENSKGGLPWFPQGADLARVSMKKYEEVGPWLAV